MRERLEVNDRGSRFREAGPRHSSALLAEVSGIAHAIVPGRSFTRKREVRGIAKEFAGKPYARGDFGCVCNGLTGFTEVLPKGAQQTGTWMAEVPASAGAIEVHVPISFPVPTSVGKEGSSKFFTAEQVTNEEFSNGCNWERSANAKPESTVPGTLCVFEDFGEGAEFQFFKAPGDEFAGGYARAGSYMFMERGALSAQTFSAGAWAISGP